MVSLSLFRHFCASLCLAVSFLRERILGRGECRASSDLRVSAVVLLPLFRHALIKVILSAGKRTHRHKHTRARAYIPTLRLHDTQLLQLDMHSWRWYSLPGNTPAESEIRTPQHCEHIVQTVRTPRCLPLLLLEPALPVIHISNLSHKHNHIHTAAPARHALVEMVLSGGNTPTSASEHESEIGTPDTAKTSPRPCARLGASLSYYSNRLYPSLAQTHTHKPHTRTVKHTHPTPHLHSCSSSTCAHGGGTLCRVPPQAPARHALMEVVLSAG